MKYTLLLCVLVLAFAACKKKDDTADYKYATELPITNSFSTTQHLDIYLNFEDYKNSRNAQAKLVIPPNSKITYNFKGTSKEQYYYMDVYADDYSNSNWAVHKPFLLPDGSGYDTVFENGFRCRFRVVHGDTNNVNGYGMGKFVHPEFGDVRRGFIDGNKAEVTWKAVGGDNWNSLTADQKSVSLLLTKNCYYTYTYKQNNQIVKKQGRFSYGMQYVGYDKLLLVKDSYTTSGGEYFSLVNDDTLSLKTSYGILYMVKE